MKKLLIAALFIFLVLTIAVFINGYAVTHRTQLYTGRTTLMVAGNKQNKINDLIQLARSNRVLANANQTLMDLGPKSDINDIYSHLIVEQVKDTNIIAIEVTLLDPNDAKMTADVVANEVRKSSKEMFTDKDAKKTGNNDYLVKTIDPAYVFPVNSRANIRLLITLLITSLVVIGIAAIGYTFGVRSKTCL